MPDPCEICDRVSCERRGSDDCEAHRVDWRARALQLRAGLGHALDGWESLWRSDYETGRDDDERRMPIEIGELRMLAADRSTRRPRIVVVIDRGERCHRCHEPAPNPHGCALCNPVEIGRRLTAVMAERDRLRAELTSLQQRVAALTASHGGGA